MSNPNYPGGPYQPPNPNQRPGGFGPPPGQYPPGGQYPPTGGFPPQGQYGPPQYGPPPGQYQQPGHGYYPPPNQFASQQSSRPGGTVPAFLAAAALILCAILSAVVAYAGRDDSPETIDEAVNRAKMTLAVFGAAFIGDDAAPDAGEMWINVTYGVAAAALLLAILLLVVRSNPFRLLVGLLGAGMTAYYVYAAIDLKSDIDKSNESPYGTTLDTDGYYTWIIVLLVVWAAVALFAILAGLSRSASGPRQGSGYGAAPNYYGQ